jgi:hypothetical protein
VGDVLPAASWEDMIVDLVAGGAVVGGGPRDTGHHKKLMNSFSCYTQPDGRFTQATTTAAAAAATTTLLVGGELRGGQAAITRVGLHSLPGDVRLVTWTIPAVIN